MMGEGDRQQRQLGHREDSSVCSFPESSWDKNDRTVSAILPYAPGPLVVGLVLTGYTVFRSGGILFALPDPSRQAFICRRLNFICAILFTLVLDTRTMEGLVS